MMPYKRKVSWSVRFEPELRDKLTAIAARENRSLNSLMEFFLGYMADYYEKGPIRPIDDLLAAFDTYFPNRVSHAKPPAKKSKTSKKPRS